MLFVLCRGAKPAQQMQKMGFPIPVLNAWMNQRQFKLGSVCAVMGKFLWMGSVQNPVLIPWCLGIVENVH